MDLSIIITTYNSESTIENCLSSVVDQLQENDEILIIDDFSTDGTVEKVKRYLKKGSIRLISIDKNKGVSHARNVGIKIATNEYLLFVDADDSITLGLLKKIRELLNVKSADLIMYGVNKLKEEKIEILNNEKDIYIENNEKLFMNFDNYFKRNLFNPVWNKVYKKSIIKENNIYFKMLSNGEDLIFNIDFFEKAKDIFITRYVGYNYVVFSETSSTRSYNQKLFDEIIIKLNSLKKFETLKNVNLSRLFINEIFSSCLAIYKNSRIKSYEHPMSIKKFTKISKRFIKYIKISNYKDLNGASIMKWQLIRNPRLFFIMMMVFFKFKKLLRKKRGRV